MATFEDTVNVFLIILITDSESMLHTNRTATDNTNKQTNKNECKNQDASGQ